VRDKLAEATVQKADRWDRIWRGLVLKQTLLPKKCPSCALHQIADFNLTFCWPLLPDR